MGDLPEIPMKIRIEDWQQTRAHFYYSEVVRVVFVGTQTQVEVPNIYIYLKIITTECK